MERIRVLGEDRALANPGYYARVSPRLWNPAPCPIDGRTDCSPESHQEDTLPPRKRAAKPTAPPRPVETDLWTPVPGTQDMVAVKRDVLATTYAQNSLRPTTFLLLHRGQVISRHQAEAKLAAYPDID